eukprot:3640965-Ditylum_brightwellii.AAC.1
MLIVERGYMPDACMHRPSRQSSHAAGMLLDVLSLCVKLTMAVIPQWMPMCLCCSMSVMSSRHRKPKMIE